MKLLVSSAEPHTKCLGSSLGSYFFGYKFSGHLTFKCQCEVIEITMSADRLLINGPHRTPRDNIERRMEHFETSSLS